MRRHRVIAVGFVLALATAACSSSESPTTTSPQPTGAADPSTSPPPATEAGALSIVDFAFEPATVTTGEGGALTVTNTGGTTHTFTMDDGSVSEELSAGDSVDVTIAASGGFHCEIHSSMTGNVELG